MEIVFDIETDGLSPIENRIVMIGIKTEKEELIITSDNEKEIIEEFWQYLKQNNVSMLIGFNIRSFDIPFIISRTFKYGIKATNLKYKLFDLRRAFNYYFNSYAKGTLEQYSELINSGSKYKGIKSSMIPELWKNKEVDTIRKYLLQDVRMTWEVYERFKECNLKW